MLPSKKNKSGVAKQYYPVVHIFYYQSGFSLIELLVGLVIGLLVTLVIMQVFMGFEGDKRTTMGNADAQTNGNVALFSLARDIQQGGYGLPITTAGSAHSPFNCASIGLNGTLPDISLNQFSPVIITNGATGLGDTISVRYSSNETGGLPTKVLARTGATLTVNNIMGCNSDELALQVMDDPSPGVAPVCALQPIQATTSSSPHPTVQLLDATKLANGGYLYCLGAWNNFSYQVVENPASSGKYELSKQVTTINASGTNTASDVVVAPEVVSLQAVYGVSTDGDNKVDSWQVASGIWAASALTPTTRNQIKAVRIAVATRNGLREKNDVTTNACITMYGDCSSAASVAAIAGGALQINISGTSSDWKKYRYRVYETVIPIRNVVWAGVH